MANIMVLGATGSLGKHVLQQAVAAGHKVTAVVRSPAKLPADLHAKISIMQADLSSIPLTELTAAFSAQDAVINTAGLVTEGQTFVDLVARLVTALEAVPSAQRPVCWLMAGAGLLDIDDAGRRGVDLPKVGTTYWPHKANFERIRATELDWRELCPGPMVEGPALGIDKLRLSLDKLPVHLPAFVQHLPGALVLPFFALRIPEMIIPYADAAAVILANLARDSALSRHRVGLALPAGMRGKKGQWAKESGSAA
jgi:putative NADH-flavin reductase